MHAAAQAVDVPAGAIHVIEAGIDVVGHQMDFGVDVPIDAGRDVMLQAGLRPTTV